MRVTAKTDDFYSDNPVIQEISQWLRKLKFKKNLLGGVDEGDVWKKMHELNSLYEKALSAERARYNALLSKGDSHEP